MSHSPWSGVAPPALCLCTWLAIVLGLVSTEMSLGGQVRPGTMQIIRVVITRLSLKINGKYIRQKASRGILPGNLYANLNVHM